MASPVWNKVLANRALGVGLLVAIAGTVFVGAFTFFRKGGLSERDSYRVTAVFDDVSGLSWKSRVQVAGIQIGEVTDIQLLGGKARLTMRIQKEIGLHADACLTKRFPSALLPDALLEASLGSSQLPFLRDVPEDRREITCVREAASVSRLMESLSKIANDIQVVSGDLAQTVGGTRGSIREVIENLTHLTRAVDALIDRNAEKVTGILENAEAFTGEIRGIAETDRDRYHAIARNVEEASARLNRVLKSVEGIVGEDKPELKESVAGAKQALERLNKTLDNLQKVTDQVAQGKGVAGKLLMDEQLGEKVARAAESISDYVDRASSMQVDVGMRGEWLINQAGTKAYFGVTLRPKPDKYYIFELVSDPRGYNTVLQETATTYNQNTGTSVTTVTSRSINEQRLAITAMYGKRYGDFRFRLGIIESTGGFGVDYLAFHDRLKLSLNGYMFTRPTVNTLPRAKLWLDWRFIPNAYVSVGLDDFLNAWSAGRYPFGPQFTMGSDVFFGAGLVFTDDDLKALLVGGGASGAAAASSAAGR